MREENFDSPLNDAQKQQREDAARQEAAQTPQGHKELIDDTFSQKKKIQQNRWPQERQWLVNISFLFGKQHFEIDRTKSSTTEDRLLWELKTLDRKKKNLRTVNYILPLYRSLLARMLQMKQRVIVDPLTNTQRDKSAARVGEEALEDFWLNANISNPLLRQEYCGMMQVLGKLYGYMLGTGLAYLMPKYNPDAFSKVYFDKLPEGMGEKIVNAKVGAVEVEVDHSFNVFEDPLGRFVIIRRILSVESIKSIYKKDVAPDELNIGDVERQLVNMLEGNTNDQKYKDAAEVLIRWDIPTADRPDGRFFACTKDKMLIDPIAIPEEYDRCIPVFKFKYLDIMLAPPQGLVDQLIPSQEEYNLTVTRLNEYKKWFAGKILIPDGCDIETKYDDQVGQIVRFNESGGKPEFQNAPSPPSFILQEILRIRKDMEDIAATHDASQGRTPKGITANAAIQTLSELDQSQLSPVLIQSETQLAFFCDMILKIMEKKYTENRLIGITGKDLAVDVKSFKGGDVAGNRRVRVSLGNNLPLSREARQEMILGYLKTGLITKDEAREMLEFGEIEGVYHMIDDQAERAEIQEMLKGVDIIPMQYENHARRIKILTDFMMGEDFKKLQQAAIAQDPNAALIVERFNAHRAKHQEYLSAEMRIMQGAAPVQGAPAPGAAG